MNPRTVIFIVDGEPFGVEADRVDTTDPTKYKIYLKGVLQGLFKEESVDAYFWDVTSDCKCGDEE